MKQLIFLFLLLFGGFLGTWIYKIETPVNRPDEYAEGVQSQAGAWWNSGTVEVDENWKLDPEIPLNYIPVPGEDELYMVVDNNGKIINYRKRTKQIDGSWEWEDVNPDIPENYEPVDGLEDVYRVVGEDGSIKYLKYIRNEDDTFAFVEVDEKGNMIDHNDDATEIDDRHIHITGNIYSLLNEHGVVIGYDERIEGSDGMFTWMPMDMTDISELEEQFSLPSGSSSLDSSFLSSMQEQMQAANNAAANAEGDTYNFDITVNQDGQNGGLGLLPQGGQTGSGTADITPDTPTIVNNSDGTHTEVEVKKETKNEGGYTTTYETKVSKTYDADGNLLSTKSEGPYAVDSQQNITKETEPVQAGGEKESTLNGEVARVCGNYSYNTELADEVLALLNAQRTTNGLSALSVSETAQQIAKLRAADMAAYDTASEDLPTYGSLGSMVSEYRVSSSSPGENIWKSIPREADEIHTRFQTLDSSRTTRMSSSVSQYGIAIVESNGNYYICEVFL